MKTTQSDPNVTRVRLSFVVDVPSNALAGRVCTVLNDLRRWVPWRISTWRVRVLR